VASFSTRRSTTRAGAGRLGYDSKLEMFLADEFSFQLANQEARAPATSLDELYKQLYLNLRGSHVAAYGPAFGNTAAVSLGECISR
jgi:hypothetical protein